MQIVNILEINRFEFSQSEKDFLERFFLIVKDDLWEKLTFGEYAFLNSQIMSNKCYIELTDDQFKLFSDFVIDAREILSENYPQEAFNLMEFIWALEDKLGLYIA